MKAGAAGVASSPHYCHKEAGGRSGPHFGWIWLHSTPITILPEVSKLQFMGGLHSPRLSSRGMGLVQLQV